MSDARAMQATERCRDLVDKANRKHPEAIALGIPPRLGLEPADVVVKFNRPAAHTSSAFQAIVTMKLSMDGSGNPPFETHRGMPAQGRTEAECLEGFFNWMTDEGALEMFRQSVKAHEAAQLDALAEAELAKKRATEGAAAARSKEYNRAWAERTIDGLARKFGFKSKKVQTP